VNAKEEGESSAGGARCFGTFDAGKTAKALGLTAPEVLLAIADEIIELKRRENHSVLIVLLAGSELDGTAASGNRVSYRSAMLWQLSEAERKPFGSLDSITRGTHQQRFANSNWSRSAM
jgi:hypothetical protein